MNLVAGYVSPPAKLEILGGYLRPEYFRSPNAPTLILHDTKQMPVTKRRKVFLQFEPELTYSIRSFLLNNATYYDSIITFDDVVLAAVPSARKYIPCACWVQWSEILHQRTEEKTFKLSGLFSAMNHGEGRLFRKVIYHRQRELSMPRIFYRTSMREPIDEIDSNPLFPSETSKFELFRTSQFSLVIENSCQTNYFTEKLIDCLVTKTIPIYWGCPNIDEYFDTTGWVVLKTPSFEELQIALNQLTPEVYAQHASVIESNFQSAMKLSNLYTNINRALALIPGY